MFGRDGLPSTQGRARHHLSACRPRTRARRDDLRAQLNAATIRAEIAERCAAIAEAIAAECARSLDDMRLTLRALTTTPTPTREPTPDPTDDDGQAAAAWTEHPDRDIHPDATIHHGPAARATTTAAFLASILVDDPTPPPKPPPRVLTDKPTRPR